MQILYPKHQFFVVPLIYAFINWPWLGIKPTTLAHQDNTLTKLATRREPKTILFFFKILFIFTFGERGREGERGDKHQYVAASHMAPTRDPACNPGVCPDWESNQRPLGSQPALNALSYTSQAKIILFKKSLYKCIILSLPHIGKCH